MKNPPRRIRIESLGVYVPPGVLRTDELLARLRFKPRWDLHKLTGIEERRAAKDEGSFELAYRAAERALAMSKYSAQDLDLIIVGSLGRFTSPERFPLEPSIASRVRRQLGARRAQVFDVTNACAGTFTGIDVASQLMQGDAERRALVLSGELTTNVTDVAVRTMRHSFDKQFASLTIGDCGAALILDNCGDDDVGFHALRLATEARYHELGVVTPSKRGHGFTMKTDPRKLHRVATKALPRVARTTLAECSWTIDDVDWIINHQTSARVLRRAAKVQADALGGTPQQEKFVINIEKYGNTSSTTHALALHEYMSQGRIRPHQRLLFSVSGSGIVSGAACYRLDDLPDRYLAAMRVAPHA